jgi:hypothetical protein
MMPCESITMAPASTMMIHEVSVSTISSYGEEDLERALKPVRHTNQQLVELYSSRWKGTNKELRDALAKETYFTPSEAIERGLADYILPSLKTADYQVIVGSCKAAPGFVLAASENKHDQFVRRRARLKLWLVEADIISHELRE